MEFPDDVLLLIREFSRPCFKYFREYNRELACNCRRSWVELKECLQHRPEWVIPAMLKHDTLFQEWTLLQMEYNLWFQEYLDYGYRDKENRMDRYLKHKNELRSASQEVCKIVNVYKLRSACKELCDSVKKA
jgi:hypothetical protein